MRERATLWHQHLSAYTSEASRLLPEQRRFVDSVNAELERFFETHPSDTALAAFATHASTVLGRTNAKIIFGRLHSVDSRLVDTAVFAALASPASRYRHDKFREISLANLLLRELSPFRLDVKRKVGGTDICDCHSGEIGDFCDSGTGPDYICKVKSQSNPCEDSSLGCGWLLAQSCNGICRPPN